MTIEFVTWGEKIREWSENPEKLLAWLLEQMWFAEIKPDEPMTWLTVKGEITIAKKCTPHELITRK